MALPGPNDGVSVFRPIMSSMASGGKPRHDFGGDGGRSRQTRRFDAVEIDQSRNAMHFRALDHEIRGGNPGRYELGSDAGIPGNERLIRQLRPVFANLGIEADAAPR